MADEHTIIVPFNEKQFAAYANRLDNLYDKLEETGDDNVIEMVQNEINLLQAIVYPKKS